MDNLALVTHQNMKIIVMTGWKFSYISDESVHTKPMHAIGNMFLIKQLKGSTLIDLILSSLPDTHIKSYVSKTSFGDLCSIFTVLQIN